MTTPDPLPPAVILLGGLGTRLRGRFPDRPKALVPVRGKPFLEWQIEWLAARGVRRIHLAAGHQADRLEEWMCKRPADGPELTLTTEPHPLGTGGGLRYAAQSLEANPLLVFNGDSLPPRLDLRALVASAARHPEAAALMAVTPIEQAGRYGSVEFGPDGLIRAFREKANRAAGWINAGVYLLRRARLDGLPAGQPVSLEHDLFPELVEHGQLSAFPFPPPNLDMGTPEGLAEMETWLSAHPEWPPPPERLPGKDTP